MTVAVRPFISGLCTLTYIQSFGSILPTGKYRVSPFLPAGLSFMSNDVFFFCPTFTCFFRLGMLIEESLSVY